MNMTPSIPLDTEWEEPYRLVECYFKALRINRSLILNYCIGETLSRAAKRSPDPDKSNSVLAMEEATRLVAAWFQSYVDEPLPENRLAVRGRLALYLADVAGQWQDHFLRYNLPGEEELIPRMKGSYLHAGPAFQTKMMAPMPIRLNPLMELTTHTWEYLDRLPALRMLVTSLLLVSLTFLLILIFWF